jgi:hypothetical protein
METPQMGMSPAMQAPSAGPEDMALFDQMRQEVSPKEFGDEMLAGAAEVDPQAVAEFRQALEGVDLPMEILDAINDLMDEVLANPADYQEMRAFYISEGVPEDLLPEQFDPEFFAAFNMAIDQMIAAPAGPQAFAEGGIAELKPIAKAIASYGRNGDTMLAHITPAEARMLRRRGGSGTINPDTGLPEYFKKFFKKVGNAIAAPFKAVAKAVKSVVNKVAGAVKKFAKSTVGKLVTTVALGFFLGPAAASFMGVTSAAGVAAVGGFIGSAGSTLAAGGNLRDALKAGAVGGLTAGAGAGLMGGTGAFQAGSYTGPTTIGGQFDSFKNAITPGAAPAPGSLAPVEELVGTPNPNYTGAAPVPASAAPAADLNFADDFALPPTGTSPAGIAALPGAPTGAPPPGFEAAGADRMGDFIQQNEALRAAANTPAKSSGSLFDSTTDYLKSKFSPSAIQEGGRAQALADVQKAFPGVTTEQVMNAPATSVLGRAYNSALPGVLSTYGPMAAAGLGTMALAGGFSQKPLEETEFTKNLKKSATDRIREGGTQREDYVQNLPGVVYDDKGEPVFGQSTPFPTFTGSASNYSTMLGQGAPSTPSIYTPPPGAIGRSQSIMQPYNNADMYSNLMSPRRYFEGGIAGLANGGYPRRTGQISGPGTEKSDSIPAMLSDGEFVMTAAAVRGAGKGSRRAGAKQMYKLMHQLEKNAQRG